ncbi:hypothetical protein ACFZAV_43975 [Streptomyces sp. NPDC008343]|uniref:hypothetical protein n=1 Tax=Streptomyces sp. NPDC008343 TaxID=3364828 RepID=UPI0036E3156C
MSSFALIVGGIAWPSTAAAIEPYNCAVEAEAPAAAPLEPQIHCFEFFDQAVSFATDGAVDASAWRYNPKAAVESTDFHGRVNNANTAKRILTINFEHPNKTGYALVVFGRNYDCEAGRERIVGKLGGWWNDRISSFVPFNYCWTEHAPDFWNGSNRASSPVFRTAPYDVWKAYPIYTWASKPPTNVPQNLDIPQYVGGVKRDWASAISVHGGVAPQAAADFCGQESSGDRCIYIEETRPTVVPTAQTIEAVVWNCQAPTNPDAPQFGPNYDAAITKTIEKKAGYKLGFEHSWTVGTGADDPVKFEYTFKQIFEHNWESTVSKSYTGTAHVPPGRIAELRSTVPMQEATGRWKITNHLLWYHDNWEVHMKARAPLPNGAIATGIVDHVMTPAERAEWCNKTATGDQVVPVPDVWW